MKKTIFFIALFLILLSYNYSQTTRFTPLEIEKANTSILNTQLTSLEKEVILYINLVRMHPKQFFYLYADSMAVESGVTLNHPNYISLKETLLEDNKSKPFMLDNNLHNMAKEMALDIGKNGIVGHTDSKKQNFNKRSKKFNLKNACAENIDFGRNDALAIVFSWLFDIDIDSLGHRVNLLNPIYTLIGVKFAKHSKYDYCCVIDLSVQ